MRRNNKKKGFTIVELVIVIAVIGILAAVMIPTFAGVISDANEKAALQEAQNVYKEAYASDLADGKLDGATEKDSSSASDYSYTYEPEASEGTDIFTYEKGDYTVTYDGSEWTVK